MAARQTTVRINAETHEVLKRLARAGGQPLHGLLAEAVEELRRKRFLEAVNLGYGEARSSGGWEEILAERAEWDYATGDGLSDPSRPRLRPRRKANRRTPGR